MYRLIVVVVIVVVYTNTVDMVLIGLPRMLIELRQSIRNR